MELGNIDDIEYLENERVNITNLPIWNIPRYKSSISKLYEEAFSGNFNIGKDTLSIKLNMELNKMELVYLESGKNDKEVYIFENNEWNHNGIKALSLLLEVAKFNPNDSKLTEIIDNMKM